MAYREHFCPTCGWSGKAPEKVAVVFHRCKSKPFVFRWGFEGTTIEEVRARAWVDASESRAD